VARLEPADVMGPADQVPHRGEVGQVDAEDLAIVG
jgi:hypothetical protein